MNRDKLVGLLALVLASFIGGAITPPLVKVGVSHLTPALFIFLRMAATSVIFIPLFWKYRDTFLDKTFYPFWTLLSVVSGLNFLFFGIGIGQTTVVASQLLYALLPISVPVAAYFMIKERITRFKVIGSGLGLMGLGILLFFSQSTAQRLALGTWQGNAWIFLAVLSYTIYLVISKKSNVNLSPYFIAGLTYLGSAIFLIPLALWDTMTMPQVIWNSSLLLAIAGVAVSSALFLCLLQFGLSRVSATTMAITALLSPVFGALGGAVVFGEKVSSLLGISLIFIVAGVLTSVFGERRGWREYGWNLRDQVAGFIWKKF